MPEWLPPGVAQGDPSRATYALTRLIQTIVVGPCATRTEDIHGRTVYNVSSPEQNNREVYAVASLIMTMSLLAIMIPSYGRFGWKALLLLPLLPFVIAVGLNVLLTIFAILAWPLRRMSSRFNELRFNAWLYQLLFLSLAIFFIALHSPLRWIGATWLVLLALNGIAALVMKILNSNRGSVRGTTPTNA